MALRRRALVGVLAALVGCTTAPAPGPFRVSEGRVAMGTVLQITLVVEDPARGRMLLDALFADAQRIESVLTTWNETSPTAAFNRAAGRGPQPVPPLLEEALRASVRGAAATDGAFDVTVGPLVRLWREAARAGRWPVAAELEAARARVGIDRLRLTPEGASLDAGMAVDFGGLGKGLALDRLGRRLEDESVHAALLDFGGSSWLARGAPPDGRGWRVLIASRAGRRHIVELRDESLSVSESLGESWEIAGRRVGHVIDPRTGLPVEHTAIAAVRAPNGEEAEMWSTALLVLSPARGLERIRAHPGLEAWMLDGEGVRHSTPGFAAEALLTPATETTR